MIYISGTNIPNLNIAIYNLFNSIMLLNNLYYITSLYRMVTWESIQYYVKGGIYGNDVVFSISCRCNRFFK